MTIATSLAVTFISSIGSSAGKLITGQVDYLPAMIMIIAKYQIAAPLGAKFGKTMNTRILQVILALNDCWHSYKNLGRHFNIKKDYFSSFAIINCPCREKGG